MFTSTDGSGRAGWVHIRPSGALLFRLRTARAHRTKMTSHEFRRLQAALRMKNSDLERVFEVSDQTIINWRRGYSRIPAAVAIVIRHHHQTNSKATT